MGKKKGLRHGFPQLVVGSPLFVHIIEESIHDYVE